MPKEWFSESDGSDYENINEIESDPEFFLNYMESEESGWSTSSDEESPCCLNCAFKTYDTISEEEVESESSESECESLEAEKGSESPDEDFD